MEASFGMHLRQKSKNIWLSYKDKNTRFFHAFVVINKKKKFIKAIKDNLDVWLFNEEEIFQSFFFLQSNVRC